MDVDMERLDSQGLTNITKISSNCSSSPINKLNLDILWTVFAANTDMFKQGPHFDVKKYQEDGARPLNTLRQTAQVCRLWREIIMGSSALWGRVLDLNLLLGEHRARWRREVIARAAQAPLHILGTIDITSEATRLFFGNCLDEHWSSIQKLVVSVEGEPDPSQIKDLWHPLQRPAPILQVFKLFIETGKTAVSWSTDLCLFANQAPSLRSFAFQCMAKAHFSLGAPWLQHLTSLDLSAPIPRFSATELMMALSNMPYLEYLSLRNHLHEPISIEPSQKVSLNFLLHLRVIDTLQTTLFLIRHIAASSKCILQLAVGPIRTEHSDSFSDRDIQDICQALSYYGKGFLLEDENRGESLSLILMEHIFLFTTPVRPHAKSPEAQYLVFFMFDDGLHQTFVSNLLSTCLDAERFTHTKTFVMRAPVILPWIDVLAPFLESLRSVTVLKITFADIPILLEVQIRYNIFPYLHTLSLQDRPSPNSYEQHFLELIRRFLENKILQGRPVATLELPAIWSGPTAKQEMITELKCLDDLRGLRVISGDNEYICGSGTEEMRDILIPI